MTDTGSDAGNVATATRCGYVALVGAPNAGKSTLLNALVGAKVSIVSPKVQTTRSRVLGIAVQDGSQMIFVDTPGIFRPRRRLERAMVAAAWAGVGDADVIVLVVDSVRGIDPDTQRIVDDLAAAGRRAVLALTKVDKVKRETLLGLADQLSRIGIFDPVFMVSGVTGSGVGDLRTHLAAAVPEGPWLFPEDQLSDMPQRLLAAEITREQVFLQLHDELPYASTVETESWEEFGDGSAKISQTIYVQRDTQKAIVLGQGGRQIKRIGARARQELETVFGHRVHLFLFVKVRENWTEDRERYEAMRLDFDS
ncbi:MAG TPA: GTPase Era [Stellaceae bacterium]|jgi:GTP-binding protein Era